MFARPSSLLVVLLASTLAFAVPIPVGEGDIVMVKPKHFEPAGSGSVGRHPAVVVSNPDANNRVKLAPVSNHQPAGTTSKPAADYGVAAGHVSLETPKVAHVDNLREPSQDPKSISAQNLANLKSHINDNCSAGLVRRDGSSCTKPAAPAKAAPAKAAPAKGAPAKK